MLQKFDEIECLERFDFHSPVHKYRIFETASSKAILGSQFCGDKDLTFLDLVAHE